MSFALSRRSRRKLDKVHPDLVRIVERAAEISEVQFEVTEGLRTLERQEALVRAGLSRTMNSKHLLQSDGYVHAFDVMATGDLDGDGDVDKQDSGQAWSWVHYVKIAKAIEQAADELDIRIAWGGHWAKLRDGCHFQLG